MDQGKEKKEDVSLRELTAAASMSGDGIAYPFVAKASMLVQFRDTILAIKSRINQLTRKRLWMFGAIAVALSGIALSQIYADTRLRHATEVINFAWSQDGQLIATSSKADQVITVWSRDGTKLKEIQRPGPKFGVAVTTGPLAFFHDNEDLIYTAAEDFPSPADAAVSVLDWKKGIWIRHLKAPPLPEAFRRPQWIAASDFRISPDGNQLLYVSGGGQFLTLLSLPSGEPLGPSHFMGTDPSKRGETVTDFEWHPNSQEFTAMTVGGEPLIFEGSDFKKTTLPIVLFNGWTLAYSPNGHLLALGKGYTFEGAGFTPPPKAGSIAIVDRETLHPLGSTRLPEYKQPIREMLFHNDAEMFFSTYPVIYSLEVAHLDQSEPQVFYRCSVICNRLHLSPDAKYLAFTDGNDVIIRHIQ
jgi:WD40 repeat protein